MCRKSREITCMEVFQKLGCVRPWGIWQRFANLFRKEQSCARFDVKFIHSRESRYHRVARYAQSVFREQISRHQTRSRGTLRRRASVSLETESKSAIFHDEARAEKPKLAPWQDFPVPMPPSALAAGFLLQLQQHRRQLVRLSFRHTLWIEVCLTPFIGDQWVWVNFYGELLVLLRCAGGRGDDKLMSNLESRSLAFKASWSSLPRFIQLLALPLRPTSETVCLERKVATLSGLEFRRAFDSPTILIACGRMLVRAV